MRDVHIRLPDRIHELLTRAAAAADSRPDDYATDLIVDALLASQPQAAAAVSQTQSTTTTSPLPAGQSEMPVIAQSHATSGFVCAGKFPGASTYSIQWAQRFVDTALRYDGVRAFVSNEGGVGFEPNFVFIERVYTQEDGFAASFYGPQSDFQSHNLLVEPGRNESYSRFKVKSPRDLEIALQCIRVSASARGLRQNA